MTSRAAAALCLVLLTGCSGVDELQRCIDHSVEEGVDRQVAENGCRDALRDE
jgi:hypothetical protein